MQYQVPQFIEIEDKIFGPLTFKQFAYVVGGGAMCFLAFKFLPIYISILIIIPVGGFSLALAFYKVNNRPFILTVESAVKFFFSKKLYLWHKATRSASQVADVVPVNKDLIPKLSESKLKKLTWSLDINDTITKQIEANPGERIPPEQVDDEINNFQGLSDDLKRVKWQSN